MLIYYHSSQSWAVINRNQINRILFWNAIIIIGISGVRLQTWLRAFRLQKMIIFGVDDHVCGQMWCFFIRANMISMVSIKIQFTLSGRIITTNKNQFRNSEYMSVISKEFQISNTLTLII